MVNCIAGVEVELVTVEVNVLPVVVNVTGNIFVNVPPVLTLADNIPVVASNDKPVPKVISAGVPVVVNLFPNNVLAPMVWILP